MVQGVVGSLSKVELSGCRAWVGRDIKERLQDREELENRGGALGE